MFNNGASSSSSPQEVAIAAAAEILVELSRGDLKAPPRRPMNAARLTWPLKGKRSRRDANLKEKMMRFSPTSPFDLSGTSGTSTSGSSSPEDQNLYPSSAGRISGFVSASSSKVEYNARPPSSSQVQASGSNGSLRPKKKIRLPDVREKVRSLEQEKKSLQQECEQLRTGCVVLSTENRSLVAKLDANEAGPSNDKDLDQAPQNQQAENDEAENGFSLPDLNFPPPDNL